jgi:riboflavin biosynthesis pyrimidine reductase
MRKEKHMEPGSLVTADGTVLPPEPGEHALRTLYGIGEKSLRLSMIRAADGSSVGVDGSSRSLNGPEDLRILRVTRSLADVVIVGAETARRERYGDIRLRADLRAARGSEPPHLAIVSRSGAMPEGLNPATTVMLTTLDAREIVAELHERGYSRLLCEGGPTLARVLVSAHLVTDYCLTTSPLDPGVGPLVPPIPEGARLAHALSGNGYRMERWEL